MPAIVQSSWVLGPTEDDEELEPFDADLDEDEELDDLDDDEDDLDDDDLDDGEDDDDLIDLDDEYDDGEEEGGGRPEDQFAGCIAVTEYSRPVPWQVLHDSTPPAVVLICA